MRKKIAAAVAVWALGAAILAGSAGNPFSQSDSTSLSAYAKNSIKSEIDAVNKRKEELQQEKKELQQDIAELEEKEDNVQEYVESLDEKLTTLSGKIEENQTASKETKKKIKALKKEKKETEADKENQYETMCRRIKYSYENGETGYLEILLGADSLSDLLSRAEYVSRVTGYDRTLLKNYQKICNKLSKAQEQLESRLEELSVIKESLRVEKSSLNTLMEKKTEQLKKYQELASEKSDAISSNDSELKKQEDELEKLMEQQRKEEEAAEAAQKKKEQEAKKNEQKNTTSSTPAPSSNTTNETGYGWPLTVSGQISSYFGYRTSPTEGASTYHKGIDISVPVGSTVIATKAGKVITATYSSSAGNYVAISHGNGVYSYYMHCSKLSVQVGQTVSKGQQIALSGNTGISTGPHLHFAIYANGAYVNPLNYVSR